MKPLPEHVFSVTLPGDEVAVEMSANPHTKTVKLTARGLYLFQRELTRNIINALTKVAGEEKAADAAKHQTEIQHIREKIADDEYERFNFGRGLTVVDADGWETETDSNDWRRTVYVENSKRPDDTSIRLSFHVRFEDDPESIKPIDAYCLDFETGNAVGRRGKRSRVR